MQAQDVSLVFTESRVLVSRAGDLYELPLTAGERRVLRRVVKERPEFVAYRVMYDEYTTRTGFIAGRDGRGESANVRVAIKRIRRKLRALDCDGFWLQCQPTTGYRWIGPDCVFDGGEDPSLTSIAAQEIGGEPNSSTTCPTCGQAITELPRLIVDTPRRIAIWRGHAVRLAEQETILLNLMLKLAPEVTTRERACGVVWGGAREPQEPGRQLDILVYRLRRKLPGIHIRPIWGVGYQYCEGILDTASSDVETAFTAIAQS